MPDANIRNAFLLEGNVLTCKTSQPISSLTSSPSIKSYVNGQQKFKTSKRYVYLFDSLLILVKKQASTFLTNTSSVKFSSKFKQAISLEKCLLKDLDDDCCFEIQVANNEPTAQCQEFYTIVTDTANQKYQWMSMLCYSQYKVTMERLLQTITEEQNKNNPLPIPPKDYIFDQPDSLETILFEQPLATNNITTPQKNPYISSDGHYIKAATLVKLVERLTHHLYYYSVNKFLLPFLMCFREFCTPYQLLQLLNQRYDVPDLTLNDMARINTNPGGEIIEREVIKRFKREYQQPIRLKVTNLNFIVLKLRS